MIIGPDANGFVDRSSVRLLVWFDANGASVAGPATDDIAWVVRALQAIADQWSDQTVQDVPPMPTLDVEDDPDWLDCTRKDVALILYKHHNVIAERGEVFPNSGLASYYLDVAGRRRHETKWVVTNLRNLAMSILHDMQDETYGT